MENHTTLDDGSVVTQRIEYTGHKTILLEAPDVEHYKIPDIVTDIEPWAFRNAPSLLSVDFNNVNKIEPRYHEITSDEPYFNGARWEGYETKVEKTIYSSIFEDSPLVEHIELPHIRSIGRFALAGLKHLHSVTFPECLWNCDKTAFFESGLKSLTSYGNVIYSGIFNYSNDRYAYACKYDKDRNLEDIDRFLNDLQEVNILGKDIYDVKSNMDFYSTSLCLSNICFNNPFIASVMRRLYADFPFANNIRDAGFTSENKNKISFVYSIKKEYLDGVKKEYPFYTGGGNPLHKVELNDKQVLFLLDMAVAHPEILHQGFKEKLQESAPGLSHIIIRKCLDSIKGDEYESKWFSKHNIKIDENVIVSVEPTDIIQLLKVHH